MNDKHLLTSEEKLKNWGYGEWVEEPDLVEFEHEGMKCEVRRRFFPEWNNHLFGGHLCGYICVPKDHPKYRKNYSDLDYDVHGGLTYGEFEGEEYWIGFDCAHIGDITPSLEAFKKTMKSPEFLNEWDEDMKKTYSNCALFNESYKNIAFVIGECKSLAEQVAKDIYPIYTK